MSSTASVTVVVPCYNEARRLDVDAFGSYCDAHDWIRFVFVDDASTDRTWESLNETFGDREECELIRHAENGGPARAILTGLRASKTEVVCSIDCDCSYDPHYLAEMIPLLGDDVDLVTASPYHPQDGRVMP